MRHLTSAKLPMICRELFNFIIEAFKTGGRLPVDILKLFFSLHAKEEFRFGSGGTERDTFIGQANYFDAF